MGPGGGQAPMTEPPPQHIHLLHDLSILWQASLDSWRGTGSGSPEAEGFMTGSLDFQGTDQHWKVEGSLLLLLAATQG